MVRFEKLEKIMIPKKRRRTLLEPEPQNTMRWRKVIMREK